MSHSIDLPLVPVFGITLALMLTGLSIPAKAATKLGNKHPVYVIHQDSEMPDSLAESATPGFPVPESPMGTRTTANDSQRMMVNAGDTERPGFQEFYPFPEPKAAAQEEDVKGHATLYWVGAVGATFAAGIAVWFLFSSEAESQSSVLVVQ